MLAAPTGCRCAMCFHISLGLVEFRSMVGTMVLVAQMLLPLLLLLPLVPRLLQLGRLRCLAARWKDHTKSCLKLQTT
jgi:hypothetical protein